MKQKYSEDLEIDLTKLMGKEFDKYKNKKYKLYSNDIKVAIITIPISLLLTQITTSPIKESLFIISIGSALYTVTSLYKNSKESKKRFTIK